MNSTEEKLIEDILLTIKNDSPVTYNIINLELQGLSKNHEYYWKLRQSVNWCFDNGELNKFASSVTKLNEVIEELNRKELIGVWIGTADGTNESITLKIKAGRTIQLVREWVESDGKKEYQLFESFTESYSECKGMIVCDLWFGEQRVTSIKLALYPNITHEKTMDGSMLWFSEGIKGFCLRVQFEYSRSDT